MQKFYYSIIAILFFSFSISVIAQPPMHAHKRMETLKKMKLLEVLNLDENKSNQLLVKYDSWSDKMMQQRQKIDKMEEELTKAIQKDVKSEELEELSGKFLNLLNENGELMKARAEDFKKFLTVKDFAKFLVFEKEFPERLQKEMMNRGRREKR